MSQRSLVEFNHDFIHFIDAHPETFMRALLLALSLSDPRLKRELREIFGVTYIAMRRYSEDDLVSAAIAKLRAGVDRQGPAGKVQGQIVLDRAHAVALLAAFGIHGESK
jgi:hypothetical protein